MAGQLRTGALEAIAYKKGRKTEYKSGNNRKALRSSGEPVQTTMLADGKMQRSSTSA